MAASSAAQDASAPAHPEEQERLDIDREEDATETSPLLPPSSRADARPDQSQPQREQSAENLLRRTLSDSESTSSKGKKRSWRQRWPSLLALLMLCLVAVLIMVLAFFAPSVVERYGKEATVFEPTSLSIDSFTSEGVKARVQGDFTMDARRVKNAGVRRFGKFGTWVARYAETGKTDVKVSLPEYGNVVLGTAKVPGVVVDVRNGHTTRVDVLADVQPGDKEGIRRIANDWVEGRLGRLRVLGEANVPLKSGLFGFGTQKVKEEMVLEGDDVPSIPEYDIKKINVHDVEGGAKGMQADVSVVAMNDYPVDFVVPKLGFEVLVDNCQKHQPYIHVGDVLTSKIHVRPKEKVEIDATGLVAKLPTVLTQDCPDSHQSPLDILLGNYIRGRENTIYIRGSSSSFPSTPQWINDLIANIIVPVPLPGKTMGHLIKNFTLADTHFSLPDPFARPGAPESQPQISSTVKALVALPEQMNFNISANRVRANADVYYKGSKLGELDLHKWQQANSSRIIDEDGNPGLMVESTIKDAPLKITDQDVFTDVIQDMLFGGKSVVMKIKAKVDVEVDTALGDFKVRGIPAEGDVDVKKTLPSRPSYPDHPNHGDGNSTRPPLDLSAFALKIRDLNIVDSTSSSLTLSALLNITNPTDYSATVPYLDLQIVKNGSLLGHVRIRELNIVPGVNDAVVVGAVYDPLGVTETEDTDSGRNKTERKQAKSVGKELLSQYISGWNTTLGIRMHEGSIPRLPKLGKALSKFPIEIPAPRLKVPAHDGDAPGDGDPDNSEGTHFIRDATMHLLTSSATFTLCSPLRHSTLIIESLDATALYKGDGVGHIDYNLPFAVPPVDQDGKGVTSPRLPVEWKLGSAGYEAVRDALGGTLKLAANAVVDVRLERFRETVWFKGRSIGAKVRL